MQLHDLLAPQCTAVCEQQINSKKRALEELSRLLSKNSTIDQTELFDALLARERLGSTSIGHGIAIPHARITGLQKPIVALLRLEKPIDFEATETVMLLCGLLVPEKATDEHLAILSYLAKLFNEPLTQKTLASCTNSTTLYKQALECAENGTNNR